MESSYFHNRELALHVLKQMENACDLIIIWNEPIKTIDDYLCSPDGMSKMAASCMLIESIGEGVKKIDRLVPNFLIENEPTIPWREIKGLRDHIAHGYFDLDSSIIFDVSKNEIPKLKEIFGRLQSCIYL